MPNLHPPALPYPEPDDLESFFIAGELTGLLAATLRQRIDDLGIQVWQQADDQRAYILRDDLDRLTLPVMPDEGPGPGDFAENAH